MAIIASDSFAGLGDNVTLAGRTLDNALGGSGTRAWANINSAEMVGNGAGQVRGVTNARNGRVELTGLGDCKIRTRFNQNGTATTNIVVLGRCTNGADNGNANALYAFLVGGSSLRVREGVNQTWAAGTDRATKAITLIGASTDYWLELEIAGLAVTARVLNDNGGSPGTLYDEVTWNASALPSGTFYGLGYGLSGTSTLWDTFVAEETEAPPPATGRVRMMVY